jgi:purine-nucleoside phosphorylase
VILGSGLGGFVDSLDKTIFIPYSEIPNYPRSTVSGHKGEWVFGYINNKPIICASGRFHIYEGFNLYEVTLPVSIIHSLGCHTVLITNAAGCLKQDWQIGDFMLISGYLDYTYLNGSDPSSVVLFEEEHISQYIKNISAKLGISLRKGIYTGVLGPSFETSAEIQDIISLGGNAVGMSTLHEIMKANELGLKVVGISCLTNYGAGMEGSLLSHVNVLETSNQMKGIFSRLLIEIV